jgi:thioredoxin
MNIFKPMNFITLFATLLLTACLGSSSDFSETASPSAADSVQKAIFISEEEFKNLVMNYEEYNNKWLYKGKIPCIVTFTADWCAPCRHIAPILDELAKEYAGKVNIYKVNIDRNRKVTGFFGIQGIPAFLFAPMSGNPALQPGGMSKEQFVDAIENFLLKKD